MRILLLGGAALAALLQPAAALTLNFDDSAAPALFYEARPLFGQYAADGITFSGTGAILSDFSAFGVTGYSTPNFVAYANGETFRASPRVGATSDSIHFSAAQSSVSLNAGSGATGLSLLAQGYDASGALVGQTTLALGSALQTLTIGGGFTTLDLTLQGGGPNDGFVIDDLSFAQGPAIDLVPEPAALALFGLGGAAIVARRRRA